MRDCRKEKEISLQDAHSSRNIPVLPFQIMYGFSEEVFHTSFQVTSILIRAVLKRGFNLSNQPTLGQVNGFYFW